VQGQVDRVDPGMGMAEPARGLAVAQPGGDPGADRGVGRGGVGVEPGQRIGRGTERAEQRLEVVGSAGATRVATGAGRAVRPPALPPRWRCAGCWHRAGGAAGPIRRASLPAGGKYGKMCNAW
jgi:hypothetical protein